MSAPKPVISKVFESSASDRLARFITEQGIASSEVIALTPDASTRNYFRIRWKKSTAVAAVYPEPFDPEFHPYLDVTRLFLDCEIPVPEIYAVDGTAGIIVQEDLGDRQLFHIYDESEELCDEYKEKAIALIAKIQNATAHAYETQSIASRLAFDEPKLSWELDFFFEHYFGSLRGETLRHAEVAELKAELNDIAAELAAAPRVLCHRDYHASNLMIDNKKRLRVVDHQDARMGPASYDLVSFLLDRQPCPPSLAELRAYRLFFLEQRRLLGLGPIDPDDFALEFRLMTIQRGLKATGTFSYQTAVCGRGAVYQHFIQPTLEIVMQAAEWLERFPHSTPDVKGTYQLICTLRFSMTTQLHEIASDKHTYINQLSNHVGAEVILKGWLYNLRSSGKIAFPQLRDGTGVVQCVVLKTAISPELWEQLKALGQESALTIKGTVRADSRAPGGYEIDVTDAEVLQEVHDYPITPKEHGTEFLMDHRHLWLRSRRQHAVLKVRHTVVKAVRDFLDNDGFTLMDSPIFTPAACEGTTTLFEVDYFDGEKAYLTQSGQLYNEATAAAFGKVYCFGPTFRAEKSKTRRHLTEFWMVEPEMSYATLDDVMNLSERFLSYIAARVLETRGEELKVLERDTSKLEAIVPPFPRVRYDDAVKMLHEGFEKGAMEAKFEWGGDFGSPDETYISSQFDKPVMVHHYPAEVKAFYMARDPERPELALGVDVLAPEGYGEVIGGGERATSLEFLKEQIALHQLPQEAFEWYLDLRRYGSVPHGGFGMGIERCTAWMCGIEHIRETIPFPRMLYRIRP